MSTLLESYLISVAAETDLTSFRNLQNILKQSEQTITGSFGKVAATVATVQTAIVGAFGALGSAVVGFGVQVANQDQSYRLFANRMMMNVEAARELQRTLKILGVTFQDIQWDKELRERASGIIEFEKQLAGTLGPNFAANARNIRELVDQFKLLGEIFEFGAWRVVTDLFDRLGISVGDIKARMGEFLSLALQNIPSISASISDGLIPILTKAWTIIQNWGQALLAVGDGFSDLINALAQDKVIDQETTRWQRWGAAIGHVADLLATVVNSISTLAALTGHTASAAVAARKTFFSSEGSIAGNWDKTQLSLKLAEVGRDLSLGPYASSLTDEDLKKAAGDGSKSVSEIIEAAKKIAQARINEEKNNPVTIQKLVDSAMTKLRDAMTSAGNPTLDQIADSVAISESGNNQYEIDPKTGKRRVKEGDYDKFGVPQALGVMQLHQAVADQYNVNRMDEADNRRGGRMYLQDLYKRYHDWFKALEAYNGGMKYVDEGHVSPQAQAYAASTLGRAMHVNVNVNVQGHDPTDQVVQGVRQGLRQNRTWNDLIHASAQTAAN